MSATAASVLPVQSEGQRDAIGPGRHGLVGQLLSGALATLTTTGHAPVVLDCGGGSGSFAVPLARAGAMVTVIDISADALATLTRRAAEAGAADGVTPIQGDVEALADVIEPGTFDLALAHGIFEAVDHPAMAFAEVAAAVRPGGLLSVLVSNPVAGVLARALAGDLAAALRELHQLDVAGNRADARGEARLDPAAVQRLCGEHGFTIEEVHGIAVFADLVPGAALDAPGARDALAALETACATRSPFAEIAGRVHVLARRPAG